jgi:hypothetical protein
VYRSIVTARLILLLTPLSQVQSIAQDPSCPRRRLWTQIPKQENVQPASVVLSPSSHQSTFLASFARRSPPTTSHTRTLALLDSP